MWPCADTHASGTKLAHIHTNKSMTTCTSTHTQTYDNYAGMFSCPKYSLVGASPSIDTCSRPPPFLSPYIKPGVERYGTLENTPQTQTVSTPSQGHALCLLLNASSLLRGSLIYRTSCFTVAMKKVMTSVVYWFNSGTPQDVQILPSSV